MVYTGGDLVLSNDSTSTCWSPIDASMANDLQRRWLLHPTGAELDSGKLLSTFSLPGRCGGPRIGALEVVNDSLVYRAGRYALADLLPMSGLKAREGHSKPSIRPTQAGWRISGGEPMPVLLRDPHGRILYRGTLDGALAVQAPSHGLFFLQTGSATLPVIH